MPEQRILQAIFPDFPREAPVISSNGDFVPLTSLALQSLFQALQENYKSEGILLPRLTTAQATTIANFYTQYFIPSPIPLPPGTQDISGQMIYNTTLELPQIFIINFDGSTPPNVLGARWWTFTIT
jgi:hypothetical protein